MGIMIAHELSYYPTPPTDEELALLTHARTPEWRSAQAPGTYEDEQSKASEDVITALGTAALGAMTGGLAETYSPNIETRQNEMISSADAQTQRELGRIATSWTLGMQLTNSGDNFTTTKSYETPTRTAIEIESAADAAYLLATQINSRDAINQALKQADYGLAA